MVAVVLLAVQVAMAVQTVAEQALLVLVLRQIVQAAAVVVVQETQRQFRAATVVAVFVT